MLLIIAGVLEYLVLGLHPEGNTQNEWLGAILIAVAFLNAFIEFYQLQKSAAILESFMNMIPAKCMALRDNKLEQTPASDLVQGDIVLIRMGDKIPADCMIFAATDLKVDNSSLTGEAEPQERRVKNDQKNPLEATNLIFNGTLAISGEAYGIVIRTGDHTVLGQIAGLTAGERKRRSPLAKEIDNFVLIISFIAIVTGVVFFGIGLKVYEGQPNRISSDLNFAISVLVAWVPEGLPATVTLLLTIAAKRMAANNVLVKDLQGVETLGAITLLATDKTGTLTRNQMTVASMWTSGSTYSALKGAAEDLNTYEPDSPGIEELIHVSALCSRTKFDRTDVPMDERKILGDATETGLVRWAAKNSSVPFDDLRKTHSKVFELPFNSETKWHMSIHDKPHANGPLTLYIKGAPERILRLCSTILQGKEAVPMTDEYKAKYDEAYEYMAGKGHRVLAFAQLLLPGDQYPKDFHFDKEKKIYPADHFCFVGLISLEDPPKHGVREAIGRCRTAGIRVMMVTGDHPLTAEAIGRKINLMLGETKAMVAKRTGRSIDDIRDSEYSAIVVHGEQIDALTDYEWDNIFSKNEVIFARTSPKHKLQIVKHAQGMGHIVGVTGDGVNDAPALKAAQLGIAMNESGSDVSKEAAAMILIDDNFASIVKGIEEGRLIFANLKRSIQYTISHSTPEVFVQLLSVVVPLLVPLAAIQILVIDLGFELFAALSFAWDKPDSDLGLMKLQPRKPVTAASIDRTRQMALERVPTRYDAEGEPVKPSKLAQSWHTFSAPFTRLYWKRKFEKTDDEILVDGNVLSWAYLEIGMIELIGCLIAYFVVLNYHGVAPADVRRGAQTGVYFVNGAPDFTTSSGKVLNADAQTEALAQAQSIVYLGIMIQQCFNLFAVKARFRPPFGRHMFSNPYAFGGVGCAAILAVLIVYIPPFRVVFQASYKTLPLWWLIPLAFGIVILIYATIRLLVLRRVRGEKWAPEVPGNLLMYPTIRSIPSRARV